MNLIVTCNAGSNNTKLAAFDSNSLERKSHTLSKNPDEISKWLSSVSMLGNIVSFSHRVVHGGKDFTCPTLITPEVLEKITRLIPLAPLHLPSSVRLIEMARAIYPNVSHIACFDTAFHSTIPEINRRLALPQIFYDEGIMRYSFHGLSYQYISEIMPEHDRVIVAHLGGGASACAMYKRKSMASTMGFSTLDGLMMGTRCGSIDAGVLLYLLQEKKMSPEELSNLLYNNSGLKGVSGISANMHELLENESPAACLAVELFCKMAAKEMAGLIPCLGGLDAIVFTGGIGEKAEPIRNRIVELLIWAGSPLVYSIPTNEELVMASAAKKLVCTDL